jgi:hypothetical protein
VSVEASGKVLVSISILSGQRGAGKRMGYEALGSHEARSGGSKLYICSRGMHERTFERDREPRSAMMLGRRCVGGRVCYKSINIDTSPGRG